MKSDTIFRMNPAAHSAFLRFLVLDSVQALADDHETMAVMLGSIHESMAADLAQLRQHQATHDTPSVGKTLHGMKGYIPMLCQSELSERLIAAEAQARSSDTGSPPGLPKDLTALLTDLETLLHEIQVVATAPPKP